MAFSTDGQRAVPLHAANREPIATSETYKSTSGAKNEIESVTKNAVDARVDDETGQG